MEEKGNLKLSNGMEVYWANLPEMKYTSGSISIQSGSAVEPHDKRGLAHVVEHMTFHGSKNWRTRRQQHARAEELGLKLNANTSFSTIAYPFHVSADRVLPTLELLKDLIYNSRFAVADLEHEKTIIADECRVTSDMIGTKRASFFCQTFYRGTPIEELVIGREDHIEGMTRQDVADFHRTHFHAANTRMYLYGNVSPDLLSGLKDLFGNVASRKPLPPFKLSLPLLLEDQTVVHSIQGLRECYGNIVFRGPNFTEKDSPTMCVLDRLLNGNTRFGLMERIRHGLGLTYGIASQYNRDETGSYFNVDFHCGPRDLQNIRSEVGEILTEINPLQSEVEKAKVSLLEEYAANEDRPTFRFNKFIQEATTSFSYKDSLESIKSTTKQQIRDVAEKYLVHQPSQTILTVPAKQF